MPKHCFNILTFSHPSESLTFYFSGKEQEGATRIFKALVPQEVIAHFGDQNHYYTTFCNPSNNFIPVTKLTTPTLEQITTQDGTIKNVGTKNSAFSKAILKRYYNTLIYNYFTQKGCLVKPNFVNDIEVWLPSDRKDTTGVFTTYDKHALKIQFNTITNGPELLLTFEGQSKAFNSPLTEFLEEISPSHFNWVIYQNQLYKYSLLPDQARRNLHQVFPISNFKIRDILKLKTPTPNKSNKYKKFKNAIDAFYSDQLNTPFFSEILPISTDGFLPTKPDKVLSVGKNSSQLIFGDDKTNISPHNGMKDYGPFQLSPSSNIQFFFILHEDDKDQATIFHHYLKGDMTNFKGGLNTYTKIPYNFQKEDAIYFTDKKNPYPEIYSQIIDKDFDPAITFIAIYITPISKTDSDKSQRLIYYKIKQLLLSKRITSQVIDPSKINTTNYHYSLPNIAIAILAKLNGIPWTLNTQISNDLIVGIGAFKHVDLDIKYLGSAFSFSTTGQFKRFESFHSDQTKELAGSILRAVKDYVAENHEIKRLVIHFYKDMSKKEAEPIEYGLRDLNLDIPIFIITINKTESSDIVAFDMDYSELMPLSGTIINIGYNRFLLYNNTRYSTTEYKSYDGFPFPVKLKINCSKPELTDDYKTVIELIKQVYQFSRMYWKSVKQQNLPVTIKYPEMIAEMLPYFENNDIPEYGKDKLWFL